MSDEEDEPFYGTGAAADRRRWLRNRLVTMAEDGEVPTTSSSLYYDGVQAKQWPSDAERKKAINLVTNKPYVRTPRQDVSDAVQWLIDHDLIEADWIVDGSRGLSDHRRPRDLVAATYEYAASVPVSIWPGPSPLVIVESRSLHAALDGDAERYGIVCAPLAGMGGRTFLRHDLISRITVDTPIGYMGDSNEPGHDIEANVRRFLEARGWNGTWKLLALTDADAAGLPQVTKYDERFKPRRAYQSVEAEALGTTALRQRMTDWLDGLLPTGFTWAKHERRTRTQRNKLLRKLA
jgi:hypothetical protein